jgi:rRNA-processing protein FCF1
MVVFDTDFLSFFFSDNAGAVIDPGSGLPVERVKERVEHLFECLGERKQKIVIPTPVLAEILIFCQTEKGAMKAQDEILHHFTSDRNFDLAPFDVMAAVEAAQMFAGIRKGDKRDGSRKTWAELKFDKQIVAIAKVRKADIIYSNDRGLSKHAKACGINAVAVWDLPLPPPQQAELFDKDEGPTVE